MKAFLAKSLLLTTFFVWDEPVSAQSQADSASGWGRCFKPLVAAASKIFRRSPGPEQRSTALASWESPPAGGLELRPGDRSQLQADLARRAQPEFQQAERAEIDSAIDALDIQKIRQLLVSFEGAPVERLRLLRKAVAVLDDFPMMSDRDHARIALKDIDWEDLVFVIGDGGDREHRLRGVNELERATRLNFLLSLAPIFTFYELGPDGEILLDHLPEPLRPNLGQMERFIHLREEVDLAIQDLRDRPKALPAPQNGIQTNLFADPGPL